MPPVQLITVTPAESGQKLLQFLERRLARSPVPRSAIQRWIRKGRVRVDGGRKKPFDRLDQGQVVRIPPYTQEEVLSSLTSKLPPGTPPLNIVFEDDSLLVIAKPAGLPAHGGTGHIDSIAARLAAAYADADFTPSLAHRLDRDTSGLLLAAKTYTRLRRLNDLVASGSIGKHYLAWSLGPWPHAVPRLLEDRLEKRGPEGAEKMVTGSGKQARCQIVPLLIHPDLSLLRITLLTGRTHQIRVQLASRGHAIIGDRKYGGPPHSSLLLHSCRLEVEGQTFVLPPSWPKPHSVSEHILHWS